MAKKVSLLALGNFVVWAGVVSFAAILILWSGKPTQSFATASQKKTAALRANRHQAQKSGVAAAEKSTPPSKTTRPTKIGGITPPGRPRTSAVPSAQMATGAGKPVISPPTTTRGEAKELRDFVGSTRECYDTGDIECAFEKAEEGLKLFPKHVQLKRWAIASACQMGREDEARGYFSDLPPAHQRAMRIKCRRYNVILDQ